MVSLKYTKRVSPSLPKLSIFMKRGKIGGIGTIAMSLGARLIVGFAICSSTYNPLLRKCGNGWAGSTASGVRAGYILSSKNFFSHAFSSAEHSFGVLKKIFSLRRAGIISSAQTLYSSSFIAEVISLILLSCSRGPSPSNPTSNTPDSSCCSSPATRISKNSSRLLLTIERNLSLSSRGNDGSEHKFNTLLLKASQLSSLLKYLFS